MGARLRRRVPVALIAVAQPQSGASLKATPDRNGNPRNWGGCPLFPSRHTDLPIPSRPAHSAIHGCGFSSSMPSHSGLGRMEPARPSNNC